MFCQLFPSFGFHLPCFEIKHARPTHAQKHSFLWQTHTNIYALWSLIQQPRTHTCVWTSQQMYSTHAYKWKQRCIQNVFLFTHVEVAKLNISPFFSKYQFISLRKNPRDATYLKIAVHELNSFTVCHVLTIIFNDFHGSLMWWTNKLNCKVNFSSDNYEALNRFFIHLPIKSCSP